MNTIKDLGKIGLQNLTDTSAPRAIVVQRPCGTALGLQLEEDLRKQIDKEYGTKYQSSVSQNVEKVEELSTCDLQNIFDEISDCSAGKASVPKSFYLTKDYNTLVWLESTELLGQRMCTVHGGKEFNRIAIVPESEFLMNHTRYIPRQVSINTQMKFMKRRTPQGKPMAPVYRVVGSVVDHFWAGHQSLAKYKDQTIQILLLAEGEPYEHIRVSEEDLSNFFILLP